MTNKLILDKINYVEIAGESVYVVYKTNKPKVEDGLYEIQREVIDLGTKDEMKDKYPGILDIEEIVKNIGDSSKLEIVIR